MSGVDWKKLADVANMEHANPLDMLSNLNKAIEMVLNGYQCDKATAKGEVVTVVEVQPSAVAQLTRSQLLVLEYINKQLEAEVPQECSLIIGDWYNGDNNTTS